MRLAVPAVVAALVAVDVVVAAAVAALAVVAVAVATAAKVEEVVSSREVQVEMLEGVPEVGWVETLFALVVELREVELREVEQKAWVERLRSRRGFEG